MSFSVEYKNEILQHRLETKEDQAAFLSAVTRGIGSLHLAKNAINLEIATESYQLAMTCAEYFKEVFNIVADINIKILVNQPKQYTISIPQNSTREMSERLGVLDYIGDMPVGFSEGIEIELATKAEMSAYVKGLIVACASISVPQSAGDSAYTGSYHFELDFNSEKMARDVLALFAELDIYAKKTERSESFVVYIKESGMLYDLMVLTGSLEQSKALFNIICKRSIRSNVNRQQNCAIANIDKAIEAGQRQIGAIERVRDMVGLDKLPLKLRVIAEIRLSNPDYTLDQIVAELSGELTKSGVNHRLRKIVEIADNLQGEDDGR